MPPLPITPRRPSSRITSAWYGSSRIEVVGPAATHFQFPASSLITTGPQWYRIPSFNLTPGGSRPPSCKYLWTASRPVNNVPVMPTSSPTLSARMADSETGVARLIISKWSDDHSSHTSHSRSEEHTSELQSQSNLVCRLLLEKKKKNIYRIFLLKNKTTHHSQT